jgi:tRNA G10  N-methylase Trm11
MIIDWIQTPLNKYTFQSKKIKEWVEGNCEGLVLNLFAGKTKLNVNEIRVDIDETFKPTFNTDAFDFISTWNKPLFDTIILDPPYSYRKAMEKYNGHYSSRFKQIKDEIPRILFPGGIVITFGYHSVSMGKTRGFEVERIAIFSHGGAIHDTISTIERKRLDRI